MTSNSKKPVQNIVLDFKGERIRKFITVKTKKQKGLTVHEVGLRNDFNDDDFEKFLKQKGLISSKEVF